MITVNYICLGIMCLICMYLISAYVLIFFKYQSILNRFYLEGEVGVFHFFFTCLFTITMIYDSTHPITDTKPIFSTIELSIGLIGGGGFIVFVILFVLFDLLKEIRNLFPER